MRTHKTASRNYFIFYLVGLKLRARQEFLYKSKALIVMALCQIYMVKLLGALVFHHWSHIITSYNTYLAE